MLTKQAAYDKIKLLTEKFADQLPNYKRSDYNETLTRKDFIDPFFEALGWDINNHAGAWEAYREVIHEDKLKINGVTTAPDYSFRLVGGQRLFFVEAKKPSVIIKDDVAPAYQVRLYGWNAKLAISVVTDFEEFAIYDCSKKPLKTDKASKARLNYFTYKDYLTNFDFFWDTFGKEQVIKGGLIKFQQSDKKGTATVDKDFLEKLDEWRTLLATNIYKNNKDISEDELNYTVQQTIDRIIFLRIAEDRGLEPYGQLKSSFLQANYYTELYRQFRVADDKYNSGLFHFKKERENSETPDNISGRLTIDNKVVKAIINSLYPPHSEYLFTVLPVEILGSAYEQFLGKQIVIKGTKATIEDKPEVRKAGGVYYTPQYIVNYIVEQTLGKLCEGKTPKEVSKLKVVDPACGSGSFLLGAYQFLLNWHIKYYLTPSPSPTLLERGEEKPLAFLKERGAKQKDAPLTPDGSLTTAEKKRILLNNIYGVDIDRNAVEVTKLSLLLKCMEGETGASIHTQMTFFNERVLPSLEKNVKCGNSLVDLDYDDGEIGFEEYKKVNAFSWEQAFPEVFRSKEKPLNEEIIRHNYKVKKLAEETDNLINKFLLKEPEAYYGPSKGFDAVIGNPPYGAIFSDDNLAYFRKRYHTSIWRGESYLLFIERSLNLLRNDGLIGMIIPDTALNLGFTEHLREFIFRNSKLQEIVSLPSKVFAQATVDTILLFTEKKERVLHFHPGTVSVKTFAKKSTIQSIQNPDKSFVVDAKEWFKAKTFNIKADVAETALTDKIDKLANRISDIAELFSGVKIYETGKGTPPQTDSIKNSKPYTSATKITKEWQPLYDGKHIGTYQLLWKENNWIKYGNWLAAPRSPDVFEGEKILIRKIVGNRLICTYIPNTCYCNTLLFILKLKADSKYAYKSLLAVINSQLIGWYFRTKFQVSDDDTFPQIMIRDILQFPIPSINKKVAAELENLATTMMKLYQQKQVSTAINEDQLNQRIAYTDDKINALVYELYGLTEEEIKIVESV